MSESLEQLRDLQVQLHEVNQEFVRAAQPLYQMTDLNDQQRQIIRVHLQAAEARWDSVNQQILKVLATVSTHGADRNENQ